MEVKGCVEVEECVEMEGVWRWRSVWRWRVCGGGGVYEWTEKCVMYMWATLIPRQRSTHTVTMYVYNTTSGRSTSMSLDGDHPDLVNICIQMLPPIVT